MEAKPAPRRSLPLRGIHPLAEQEADRVGD